MLVAPGLPEKKQEKKTGKPMSKIGWCTLLRGGGGFINISRDRAYLIAGGSLIAPGHYISLRHQPSFFTSFSVIIFDQPFAGMHQPSPTY